MSFSFSVRWLIETDARDVRGRHRAARLQDFERLDAGQRGRVIAPAGQRDEAHVALQHDGLGGVGNADQAEPRGELALVHHAFADQIGIFGVMHDQRVEIAGVGQRAAHHLRVGDAACRRR